MEVNQGNVYSGEGDTLAFIGHYIIYYAFKNRIQCR